MGSMFDHDLSRGILDHAALRACLRKRPATPRPPPFNPLADVEPLVDPWPRDDIRQAFVNRHNMHRARHGMPPVTYCMDCEEHSRMQVDALRHRGPQSKNSYGLHGY